MNGQRLLKTIRQAIASQAAVGDDAAPQSLTRLMREIQSHFDPLKSSVPKPRLPLPAAEVVAAFVDGQATAREEEQVVQACVHDVGILLQVASTVQAQSIPVDPVSPALRSRLLSLQFDAKPSKMKAATSLVPAELVDGIPIQPTETKTLPTQRAKANRIVPWIVVGALAVCLLVASSWIILRAVIPNFNGIKGTKQVAENEADSSGDPSSAIVEFRSDDRADERLEGTVQESPSNAEDVDTQETKFALEQGNGLRESTSQTPVVQEPPSNESNSQGNDSATATPDRLAANSRMQTFEPEVKVRPTAAIRWKQVSGILAEQQELGYDQWKVIAETRDQEQSNTTESIEQGSWLTLPTCFAQGELASGGRLVMNQDTHLKLRAATENQMDLNMPFGSIALIDVPAGKRWSIATSPAKVTELEFRSLGSVQIQRIAGGIQFTVADGDVTQDGMQIPRNKVVIYRQEVREIGPDAAGLPAWAVDLPKSPELPRPILANFLGVDDLGAAMDRQLVNMARNLNPSNPLSIKNFRQLCQWRSRLSVEEPTSSTKHPVWFVRNAAFDSILLAADHLPMLNARQDLVARLPGVSVIRIRAWVAMASGGQKPTRQDLSQWLGFIVSDDSVVAAFGDYLLRKQYPNGPAFDPNSDAAVRRETQRAWRAQVAGG